MPLEASARGCSPAPSPKEFTASRAERSAGHADSRGSSPGRIRRGATGEDPCGNSTLFPLTPLLPPATPGCRFLPPIGVSASPRPLPWAAAGARGTLAPQGSGATRGLCHRQRPRLGAGKCRGCRSRPWGPCAGKMDVMAWGWPPPAPAAPAQPCRGVSVPAALPRGSPSPGGRVRAVA